MSLFPVTVVKPAGMAIQAPSTVVVRMALMTVMTRVLVKTGLLMTGRTAHAGMGTSLNVEPEGAVRILPGVLEMTLLAILTSSI